MAQARLIDVLAPGAVVLRKWAAKSSVELLAAVEQVVRVSPYRSPITPFGKPMSVSMTNCGEVGWISDRGGYRYGTHDPITGRPWPAMPEILGHLAIQVAQDTGYDQYQPDVCLVNRYEPGASMGMHRDIDERDFGQPIVSVSLGLPITFRLGGQNRGGKTTRTILDHGDVMVMGGTARLAYHGVSKLRGGVHPLTGSSRVNLTFRVAR